MQLFIEGVVTNKEFVDTLIKFPDLKQIYEDMIALYYEYHNNKTPTGIEKDLCDRTYALETNESFKKLSAEYPDIMLIYQKLRLLYKHYEAKQKIYDELEKLREERKQKGDSQASAPVEEKTADDKFDKNPADAAATKKDEKK